MKVFYSDKMVANSRSFSPSAAKPAQAVRSWMDHGFAIEVVEPAPATNEQLYRAHHTGYVDGVLSRKISNGFGNRDKAVAKSLRHTSGAMVAATREALRTGGFACAPVSGFHHACYGGGGGFCTFNGLMVAALDLIETGAAKKVGILDCDQHYGNGTDDIIEHLGLSEDVIHFTAGRRRFDAEFFIDSLPEIITNLYGDCDVLIYQAGADPHVNDPLGGWMTTDQLFRRDIAVFETARSLSLPVAWDLAGGYQKDADGGIRNVLAIHDNTMRACLDAC